MVHQVTLLTGDRLHVQAEEDGRLAITVEAAPRAGDWPVVFVADGYGDRELLIPSDALPLVHAGVLDPALFDLRYLLEQGYSDAQAAQLPLIISMEPAAGPERLRGIVADWSGTTEMRALPSVDGGALALDRDASAEFWRTLTDSGVAWLDAHGISRIWLDRRIRPHLEQSAWIVGAPEIWEAYGLTGAGVRVAVLDSGVDASHPDLVGRVVAQVNFSDAPDVADVLGHGTHVAGIVAGDGSASNGRFTGIAPEALLLSGKVLNDEGEGLSSWVIAAMEWAAREARIVNISVGGDPTDGTDPISIALNHLAQDQDVLFVVSAGNDGTQGSQTIGTPGSAHQSLAVGSVNKLDVLAATSSRGPRLGDLALKPDMVAPGVAIVAARAAGTSAGTPVDANYTRISGTSMAAPHVAGAAALMLQQQPTLPASELKSLLVTHALPLEGLTVYEQGGGRLRILHTLDGALSIVPAPASLGYFPFPQFDTPEAVTALQVRNRESVAVEVTFELDVRNELDTPVTPAMLRVVPQSVELDPGQSTTINLHLDPTRGEPGLYGGRLTAHVNGQVVSQVPVGFYKEPQMFELRIDGIRRDGRPAADSRSTSGVHIINVNDSRVFATSEPERFEDGSIVLNVPAGHYAIVGFVNSYHALAESQGFFLTTEWVFTAVPEFEVFEHTHIVLDAREANEITFAIEGRDTERVDNFYWLHWWRAPVAGGVRSGGLAGAIPEPDQPLRQFALETNPVGLGGFEMVVHGRLRLSGTGPATPELYDLVLVEEDQVPDDLTYVLAPAELARVDVGFHSHRPEQLIQELRNFWRPWQNQAVNHPRAVAAPGLRTDYLKGGDTRYQQHADLTGAHPFTGPGRMVAPAAFYQDTYRYSESWFRQPARPGPWPVGSGPEPWSRQGRELVVNLVPWTNWQRGHTGVATNVDSLSLRLFQEDELIAVSNQPEGTFMLNTTWGEYRIELDVSRNAEWWSRSVSTHTAWTVQPLGEGDEFKHSERMIFANYTLDVDLLNAAQPWISRIQVHPESRPGPAAVTPATIRLWTSYDDGLSWQERKLISSGRDGYTFALESTQPPEARDFVSLRLDIQDTAGNRLEQRIMRAYALPDPPP